VLIIFDRFAAGLMEELCVGRFGHSRQDLIDGLGFTRGSCEPSANDMSAIWLVTASMSKVICIVLWRA